MLRPSQGALHSCMLVEIPWDLMVVPWVTVAPRDVSATTEAKFFSASLWISHSKADLFSPGSQRSFSQGQHAHQRAHDIDAYKPECNSLIKNENDVCRGE